MPEVHRIVDIGAYLPIPFCSSAICSWERQAPSFRPRATCDDARPSSGHTGGLRNLRDFQKLSWHFSLLSPVSQTGVFNAADSVSLQPLVNKQFRFDFQSS
jgi:hypothetical protein